MKAPLFRLFLNRSEPGVVNTNPKLGKRGPLTLRFFHGLLDLEIQVVIGWSKVAPSVIGGVHGLGSLYFWKRDCWVVPLTKAEDGKA